MHHLAAGSVSLSVISDGTHAEDVRRANMAASAMSAGCRHLSGMNMPSVIGVLTAAAQQTQVSSMTEEHVP